MSHDAIEVLKSSPETWERLYSLIKEDWTHGGPRSMPQEGNPSSDGEPSDQQQSASSQMLTEALINSKAHKADRNKLDQCTELLMTDSGIDDVGVALNMCPQLRVLSLKGNRLERLPPSAFKQLVNMRSLSLDFNRLTSFPTAAVDRAPKLEILSLAHNKLQSLESTAAFPKLHTLNVSFNAMSEIPAKLFKAPNLTALDISNCNLSSLNGINALNHLVTLHASRNSITSFSGLEGLNCLEELDLSHNAIRGSAVTKVTHSNPLKSLVKLTELNVSYNDITTISVFPVMPNLTTLRLNNNSFHGTNDADDGLSKQGSVVSRSSVTGQQRRGSNNGLTGKGAQEKDIFASDDIGDAAYEDEDVHPNDSASVASPVPSVRTKLSASKLKTKGDGNSSKPAKTFLARVASLFPGVEVLDLSSNSDELVAEYSELAHLAKCENLFELSIWGTLCSVDVETHHEAVKTFLPRLEVVDKAELVKLPELKLEEIDDDIASIMKDVDGPASSSRPGSARSVTSVASKMSRSSSASWNLASPQATRAREAASRAAQAMEQFLAESNASKDRVMGAFDRIDRRLKGESVDVPGQDDDEANDIPSSASAMATETASQHTARSAGSVKPLGEKSRAYVPSPPKKPHPASKDEKDVPPPVTSPTPAPALVPKGSFREAREHFKQGQERDKVRRHLALLGTQTSTNGAPLSDSAVQAGDGPEVRPLSAAGTDVGAGHTVSVGCGSSPQRSQRTVSSSHGSTAPATKKPTLKKSAEEKKMEQRLQSMNKGNLYDLDFLENQSGTSKRSTSKRRTTSTGRTSAVPSEVGSTVSSSTTGKKATPKPKASIPKSQGVSSKAKSPSPTDDVDWEPEGTPIAPLDMSKVATAEPGIMMIDAESSKKSPHMQPDTSEKTSMVVSDPRATAIRPEVKDPKKSEVSQSSVRSTPESSAVLDLLRPQVTNVALGGVKTAQQSQQRPGSAGAKPNLTRKGSAGRERMGIDATASTPGPVPTAFAPQNETTKEEKKPVPKVIKTTGATSLNKRR